LVLWENEGGIHTALVNVHDGDVISCTCRRWRG
jgi:hypothetical protein